MIFTPDLNDGLKMSSFAKTFVSLISILLLCSCATSELKTPLEPASLQSPAKGETLVYIMRTGGLIGIATPGEVIVDGKELGTLWNNDYIVVSLLPGDHKIKIKWLYVVDEVQLVAHPDTTLFVETGWRNSGGCLPMAMTCVGTSTSMISKTRALRLLPDMKEIARP